TLGTAIGNLATAVHSRSAAVRAAGRVDGAIVPRCGRGRTWRDRCGVWIVARGDRYPDRCGCRGGGHLCQRTRYWANTTGRGTGQLACPPSAVRDVPPPSAHCGFADRRTEPLRARVRSARSRRHEEHQSKGGSLGDEGGIGSVSGEERLVPI